MSFLERGCASGTGIDGPDDTVGREVDGSHKRPSHCIFPYLTQEICHAEALFEGVGRRFVLWLFNSGHLVVTHRIRKTNFAVMTVMERERSGMGEAN